MSKTLFSYDITEKEQDIRAATEKIRNKMEEIKRENSGLHQEIDRLNAKLEESLTGLRAASRLGDQLETKTAQINDLKEQGNIFPPLLFENVI